MHSLFRCISTLQWSQTRDMLQAEIETQLSLAKSDILPQINVNLTISEGIFIYHFTCALSATGVLSYIYIYIYSQSIR